MRIARFSLVHATGSGYRETQPTPNQELKAILVYLKV
jgi:hypothetical protein